MELDKSNDQEWCVDSYQLPVPLGDCAIHFLVVQPEDKSKKPDIITSILVDGGKGKTEACDVIEGALMQLKGRYNSFPGKTDGRAFPGFKNWLVTHWGDDHYAGALDYFRRLRDQHIEQDKPLVYGKPIVYGPVSATDPDSGITNNVDKELIVGLFSSSPETSPNLDFEIGKDFFKEDTGREHPESHGKPFSKWLHDLELTARPSFLCVAFNGYCYGTKERFYSGKEDRNKTSAFFVISWPKTNRICYYAAGDGNTAIERFFASQNFFGEDTQFPVGTLVAKATHHGALNQFNEEFYKAMSPQNYVVSAGKQYGHPTAALLVKLAYLNVSHNIESRLSTTTFPYYLAHGVHNRERSLNIHAINNVLGQRKETIERASKAFDNFQNLKPEELEAIAVDPHTEQLFYLMALTEKDEKDRVAVLQALWQDLSLSPIPVTQEDEGKRYRVEMRFTHKDSISEVDIRPELQLK